jgi:hypothetical protein
MKKRILSLLLAAVMIMLFALPCCAALYQIHVTTPSNGTITISVEPNTTIAEVKNEIQAQTGIAPAQQNLFFDDKLLNDSYAVSEHNIQREANLSLTLQSDPNDANKLAAVTTGVVHKIGFGEEEPLKEENPDTGLEDSFFVYFMQIVLKGFKKS